MCESAGRGQGNKTSEQLQGSTDASEQRFPVGPWAVAPHPGKSLGITPTAPGAQSESGLLVLYVLLLCVRVWASVHSCMYTDVCEEERKKPHLSFLSCCLSCFNETLGWNLPSRLDSE